VYLLRALVEQEQPAADQDQVAPREVLPGDGKHRRGQPHDPRDGGEQGEPHRECQAKPDVARSRLLRRRQPPGENRKEDQVVDAEHDLKQGQRQQARPDLRISEPVHQ
jgi:hypothetical protein